MRNPYEIEVDTSICAHCEEKLPPEPHEETSWAYNGFCGPACCLHYLLTIAGVNSGISMVDAIMGRKAIEELKGKS